MKILKNLDYLKKKNQKPINMSTFSKHDLKKKKVYFSDELFDHLDFNEKKDHYYPIVNIQNIKKNKLEDPIFTFEGYDDEHYENVLADNMPRSFNYNHLHYLLRYIQKNDISKIKAFIIGLYDNQLFIGIQGFIISIPSSQFKRFNMIQYWKRINASFYYKAKSLQFFLKDLDINHKDFNFTVYRKFDSQEKIPTYDNLYKLK
jgi:hypothetical protein